MRVYNTGEDWSTLYVNLGNGGWRNPSGGGWSFNCVDCWFHMEDFPQVILEGHAFSHKVRKHHSIIITDPEGNKKLYESVILEESDEPPF